MPGPTPKDPALRQRRNRETTAATFIDTSPLSDGEVPALPAKCGEDGEPMEWRPEAVQLWDDLWTSPMASEYMRADQHRILLYVELWDCYWRKPSVAVAAELRLQGVCLGVTPIDRRRLQWEIKRVEKPVEVERPKPERVADPRSVLKAVT